MSQDQNRIIIKEINYWKEHNLLPVVYCDFLLALYTHGQNTEEFEMDDTIVGKKYKWVILAFNILAVALVALSLVVVYFTEIHLIVQISILVILLMIMYWLYRRQRMNDAEGINYILILGLILLLITSVHSLKIVSHNEWIINGVIFINIITWFFIGLKKRYKYLYIISILAFILMVYLNVL